MNKSYIYHAVFFIGLTFSALLVFLTPEIFHWGDMKIMGNWARHWSVNWKEIYLNCRGCNYPFVGTFAYAGVGSFLGITGDFLRGSFHYRLFLSGIDGLNVLLIYALLKELMIYPPAFWAGVIGLLPSSWAGGALWGQIDTLGQFFILASLLWIIFNNNHFNGSHRKFFWLYVTVASLLISMAVLTKQLTIFSIFSLSLLLFASIVFYCQKWLHTAAYAMLALCTFLTVNLIIDSSLGLKEPYFSHLLYIWRTGSGHINKISGNGFNIWVFLGRNMLGSSNTPFYLFFTPKITGIILFIAYLATITFSLALYTRKILRSGTHLLNHRILLNWAFHLALVNLGMTVFLSGTHERYLYHFYPFIIIVFLGKMKHDANSSGSLYSVCGLLVYSVLYGAFVLFKSYHAIVGILHLILLGYLTFLFLKDTYFLPGTKQPAKNHHGRERLLFHR